MKIATKILNCTLQNRSALLEKNPGYATVMHSKHGLYDWPITASVNNILPSYSIKITTGHSLLRSDAQQTNFSDMYPVNIIYNT
jgi:hypothetical protein